MEHSGSLHGWAGREACETCRHRYQLRTLFAATSLQEGWVCFLMEALCPENHWRGTPAGVVSSLCLRPPPHYISSSSTEIFLFLLPTLWKRPETSEAVLRSSPTAVKRMPRGSGVQLRRGCSASPSDARLATHTSCPPSRTPNAQCPTPTLCPRARQTSVTNRQMNQTHQHVLDINFEKSQLHASSSPATVDTL